MKMPVLVVVFLAELAVLGAVGRWGFTARPEPAWKLVLGIGGPAVMIALWALFGAPTAAYKVHGVARVAFELAWFGTGVTAVAVTGYLTAAVAFGATIILAKALAALWHL
ncbi:YrdB family protein [Yinghuangia soli]|uniref:YrdB family protein n=1 Tax=Yinghuangia soli TaxID=2908204 RepID=A0AA41U824_9ACTN|nr:YrdB family protein [Yinghuangia soli]MCF2532484.1 YrdB family protein [Yinghuangia soli]